MPKETKTSKRAEGRDRPAKKPEKVSDDAVHGGDPHTRPRGDAQQQPSPGPPHDADQDQVRDLETALDAAALQRPAHVAHEVTESK